MKGHITVKSRDEAWSKANEIFPTDYMEDARSSEAAGYPIYKSTMDGNNSWISDLNTSLEVNVEKGKGIDTFRIWIESEPEITEEKIIRASSVRDCCIKNNLYTCGTCREYDAMLNMADDEDYSLNLLYKLAKDIVDKSEDQTIENVMFLLNRDAVLTFYHIG